jgi:hypothetical protein
MTVIVKESEQAGQAAAGGKCLVDFAAIPYNPIWPLADSTMRLVMRVPPEEKPGIDLKSGKGKSCRFSKR